jgi:hypothetical protein
MDAIKLWLLYPQGKNPSYPIYGRSGEPQSWSGRCGIRKKLFLLPKYTHFETPLYSFNSNLQKL